MLKTYIDEMQFELPQIAPFNVPEGMIAVSHALRRKK